VEVLNMGLKDVLNVRTELTSEEKQFILKKIRDQILSDYPSPERVLVDVESEKNRLQSRIRSQVIDVLNTDFSYISLDVVDDLTRYIFDHLFGLGIIESLLRDPKITDIMIQGTRIVVVREGIKEELVEVFSDEDDVRRLIDRMTSPAGKKVDVANPSSDCDLYDGSRCHIIIPPVADKIYITIRKLGCMDLGLTDWVEQGVFTVREAVIFKKAIKEKKNILISGGTGAGKTTLLNSLTKLIHPDQIIVTLEDTYELKLSQKHVKRLLTREGALDGRGKVTFRMLLKNALRMNPDRLIMGEVRDESAYDLLHALNIGHRGSLSTIHANSTLDALWRLETLALAGAPRMPLLAIKRQIARVIDVLIQLRGLELESGQIKKREVLEITYLKSFLSKEDDYVLETLAAR
jgi:pilus assembly protein CpaF